MEEPDWGSVVSDEARHEWHRTTADGRWRCANCENPPGVDISWGWDEVQADAIGELRIIA